MTEVEHGLRNPRNRLALKRIRRFAADSLAAGRMVTKFGNEFSEVFPSKWIAIDATRPQLELVGSSDHQLFGCVHSLMSDQSGGVSNHAIALVHGGWAATFEGSTGSKALAGWPCRRRLTLGVPRYRHHEELFNTPNDWLPPGSCVSVL